MVLVVMQRVKHTHLWFSSFNLTFVSGGSYWANHLVPFSLLFSTTCLTSLGNWAAQKIGNTDRIKSFFLFFFFLRRPLICDLIRIPTPVKLLCSKTRREGVWINIKLTDLDKTEAWKRNYEYIVEFFFFFPCRTKFTGD